jgi:hypothetical protein
VTQQPARENERQMEVRRQRVRIERHQHDENGVTRGDATTSQGEREGGAKASATQEQLNIQCAAATGERAWSLDDGYELSWKCRRFRCRPQLVLTTWFRVFPTRRPDTADVSATS